MTEDVFGFLATHARARACGVVSSSMYIGETMSAILSFVSRLLYPLSLAWSIR
jgi:hypothetical protein